MTEQESESTKNELLLEVDEANTTEKLMIVAEKVLELYPEFIAEAELAMSKGKPWVGFKIGEISVSRRSPDGIVSKKILRIHKKTPNEIVESAQLVHEKDTGEGFEGLSYIIGVEKAEMIYPEEGSYRSEYSEPPLIGDEAAPKVKELIKSLI